MDRYLREKEVLEAARERRQARAQQNQLDKYLEAQRQAQAAQQAQQAQAQQQDSDAGFFERVGETIGDVAFDVGYGLLDGIEGIADLGIGLVGAVGGIFDDDFKETMKEAIEYDASYNWVEKHGPDFSDSYLSDDSLVKQIARSVGGMLPSIAVSMIPGAGPGAALGTLGVSAAGSGTQEAYRDGADFYKGLGYGIASGGVEVASEALLGGVTSKVFGGGLINPGNAVAKTGAKRIFKGMAEEAAEEVFASAVNPLAKTIYKGSEALGEYATPDFYKGLAESAIAGAGAAGAIGAFTGDFSKKRDVAASMEAATELRNKRAELFNEDTLTEEADTNIRESVEANLAKVENILKKMSAEKRANLIKEARLENLFEENGSMRENAARALLGEQVPTEGQEGAQSVFGASGQRYASPALWNQQQRVSEELAQITEDLRTQKNNPEIADVKIYQGELSDTERPAFKQIKKAVAALSKRTATGLNFVITEASPDYSGVLPGKSNTVYITKDTLENGTWARSLVHEIMHYNEGTREYNKLLSVLTSDADTFEKTVAALTQEGNPYGFTAELYDSMIEKLESGTELTEDEQTLRNEMGARLAEELLGNDRFIERIAQKDASLARRILAKIRDLLEAFRTLGNKEARAEYKRLRAAEKLYMNAIESSGYNRLADEITEEIVKRGEEREESMKSSNTDGRFGMGEPTQDDSQFSLKLYEDVDNYTDEEYNEKNKNSGGYHERENNRDTGILEGKGVSAADRGGNDIWKQSENTKKLKGLLGYSDDLVKQYNFKAGQSEWLENYTGANGYGSPNDKQKARRFLQGLYGKISKVKLKSFDSVGRKIPIEIQNEFSDTFFKTEDGVIISLWHWTNAQFDNFDRGDIGFHAGTFDAAHAIMFDKSKPGEKGFFKELYFNSKNPLFIDRDLMQWDPYLVSICSGLFNEQELNLLSSLDGYDRQQYDSDASVQLRKMLKEKGYDSIIYTNDWEGGLSVIAFDNDQFYTVAENGIEKRKQDSSENVNSKSQFSLDYKPTPKDPATAYIVEGWGEDTDTDTEQAQKPAKKTTEAERKASIALSEEKAKRRNFNYTEGQRARDYADENTNKVYTKEDASAIVSSILADRMNFGEVYGSLRGQSRNKIVKALWQRMNSSEPGNRAGLALNAAEYIIQSAVVEDALYDPMNDYYRDVVEMLRPYVRKLNLSGLDGEIKHRYGKDAKRIYSRWNKRNGLSPDVAAQELAGLGYQIDATNPADILFEIADAYQKATKAIDDRAKTLLRDTLTAKEHNELKQEIARDILISFDTHGSESKLAKFKNEHEKSMQLMRKRIDAANERTRLSREQAKIDVQAAEDKAKRAREEARETEARNKEMNRVIYQLEKARDLKKGTYHNHAEFKEDKFEKSIGQLGGLLMQRTLKQRQARTVAKALLEWYTPDNKLLEPSDQNSTGFENAHTFQEDIRQKIESIANGEGFFTSQELRTFAQVVGYFNHFVESFDKVYKNGKYVEARAIAERYVEMLKAAKKKQFWGLSRWFESGYAKTFSDPLSLMKYADKYDPHGFFTETFGELEKAAVGAAVTEMELMEKYNKFFKDHKGYEKRLEKGTVDYNNVKINVDAAICLYMTSKVDDAWKGLVKSGATLFVDGKSQELAKLLKEDGEITDAEIETLVEEMRSKLRNSFTKEDLAFIETMEKILNKDCSKLKVDTDMLRLGYSNVMEKYYFPLMRADVARTVDQESFFDGVNRVSSLSMNKDRVKGASGRLGILRATEVLQRHIRQIAMYSNLAIPIDNYNRLVNLNTGDNAGAPDSVASNLKGGDKDFYAQARGYLKDLIDDMQGRPSRSDTRWYNGTLSKIRGGYAKFQLGANTKTWLTQLSSFIAATNVLDYSSIVKGMAIKGKFDEVDQYCKLAQHRNTENTVVKAQGVIDKTGKLGDVLMTPIGWVDRVVVVELFGACQVQVEADGGAKIGTEENKVAAGKLLERVILETQQNSVLTGKSAAMRSGDELLKSLTMFSSDSMKIFGRFMDAQGERLAIKYELKNNKNLTAEERKTMETRLKAANKQIGKATTAMVASAVFMAMLGLLFRTIRRKNKDKDAEEIAWETAFDGVGNMLGGLPIIRDIYSAFSDGYEMENFAFAVLNDAVEATNATISLAQKAASGTPVSKQEVATSIRKLIYSAGQMLGIPTRNLFNTASSITGMISNSGGYYIDDLFYKQPYKSDLKKAVEDGDERMIATITGLMLDEKVGTQNAETRRAMSKLIEEGYDVLPRSFSGTINNGDEQIELNRSEKSRFEKIYSTADTVVNDLTKLQSFQTADSDAQAKAIKFVYDTYYALAKDDILGTDTEEKNVLFAQAIDVEKLALIASVARSMKADTDKDGKAVNGSRQRKITAYIAGLKLTAAEKYMLMGYLGYTNTNGEAVVRSYINTLNLSNKEKQKLLEYSGYKKEA